MTFRSDATEGVWSPTQNVAVQTEANVVAFFFFHQCGFYDPTHHIRGCQKIIWNFALKGRALRTNLTVGRRNPGLGFNSLFNIAEAKAMLIEISRTRYTIYAGEEN